MWPWGHAAVGYLLYTLYLRAHADVHPTARPTFALLVGTQFPDLVDKPLAWDLALLPGGRAVAHSLLVLVPVCTAVIVLARRAGQGTVGTAFASGALSHTFVDALPSLLRGEFIYATYLFWPVLPYPPFEGSTSIVAHFLAAEVTPYMGLQFLLAGIALVAWWADGRPGLLALRRGVRRRWHDARN